MTDVYELRQRESQIHQNMKQIQLLKEDTFLLPMYAKLNRERMADNEMKECYIELGRIRRELRYREENLGKVVRV